MLESEAKEKRCPLSQNKSGFRPCLGSECMGWEEWMEYANHDKPTHATPFDPPQGDCGMKPQVTVETT